MIDELFHNSPNSFSYTGSDCAGKRGLQVCADPVALPVSVFYRKLLYLATPALKISLVTPALKNMFLYLHGNAA